MLKLDFIKLKQISAHNNLKIGIHIVAIYLRSLIKLYTITGTLLLQGSGMHWFAEKRHNSNRQARFEI